MIDKTLIDPNKDDTKKVHDWMKSLDDSTKLRFAINWKMPHTLFNIACKYFPGGSKALQDVDWYDIYKSRDLGVWSHGGTAYCM